MRTLWVCLWWRQKRRRRVWLLIDELTCGLQMTGREAPSWGMPLLFSIQGGNEFLVIFQKGCPWAQASPLPGDRNRRESQLMWWWTLFFARFFDGRAHVRKGLDADHPSRLNRLRQVQDRIVSTFEVPSGARWRTPISPLWAPRRNFSTFGLHLWCIQPNLELMYIGGGLASVQWRVYLSCNEPLGCKNSSSYGHVRCERSSFWSKLFR